MIVRQVFPVSAIAVVLALAAASRLWPTLNWGWLLVAPLVGLGVYDMLQKKHTILRLYPVIGHLRYLFESVRPEIQQYFVESDTNGVPVNREFRALIYQRAKGALDTRPFGTLFNVYDDGYEWISHSMAPVAVSDRPLRVTVGGPDCPRPYTASVLNISAMSYGALSKNAILALNRGARLGGFAHNTGEGGISPYHLEHDADLIWQIGTGYFGCRDTDGGFDPGLFSENAQRETVRMIEVKLSQGAKPGHGGILPAAKLTEEIAAIRHVPRDRDVISPPGHSAFSTPAGLLEFIARLRELSGGKPVGFKLCVGDRVQFFSVCQAMLETGITPDFITVDGAEGGTGAAPIELTNSVGMPLRDGLHFVHQALRGIGVRDRVCLIGAGKVFSAFHLLRLIALGADAANSARGMMFALGCIQSRNCNNGRCPSGVATQNPARYKGLDVTDKGVRVANYHRAMMRYLAELMGVAGIETPGELQPAHIHRRVSQTATATYAQLYPAVAEGCLLTESDVPEHWREEWGRAQASAW